MPVAAAFALALLLAGSSLVAADEEPVRYRISFPNRAHHEAEVEIRLRGLGAQPLEVRMSRTSPGRYRLHEFVRNVYRLRAEDGEGKPLAIEQRDVHGWTVSGHRGEVVIRYTVYGDLVSGTYSAVDTTHAHLNPPATFAWARGLESRPVVLEIVSPEEDWQVATQLEPTADRWRFRAPSLQYFFDSPIEIGPLVIREWQMTTPGSPAQTFRLAVHHLGTDAEVDDYAEMARLVAEQAIAVFGELPRFDYGTYTFLVDYLPWADGDAMEHRNSTPLTSSRTLERDALVLLETLSHELFHAWNVERIRPASLEPFDFERLPLTDELWFAEGVTNYYDGLLLHRAGLWSLKRMAEDLTTTVDRIVTSPATRFGSPVEMSRLAPFRDRALWQDPQNADNTYLHYYSYGDAVALALDLELRTNYESSLDELMRVLWRRHGTNEIPYTNADLEAALAEVSERGFARDFSSRHVYGRELPDYGALLAPAGLVLRPAHPRAAWLGDVDLAATPDGLELTAPTLIGSPLYEAGIDRGDRLLELDGRTLRSLQALTRRLERRRPEDRVRLAVETRTGRREVEVVLGENPHVEVVPLEGTGAEPSAAQERLRRDWLGPKP